MKLYYFDIRARAEPIRLLLYHAKIPFQDIRVQFQDWPQIKNCGKFPLGQLPILELENGEIYNQATAILAYLGMKYGYLSKDPECHYKTINLCSGIADAMASWAKGYFPAGMNDYATDEIAKNAKNFNDNMLPLIMKVLERNLTENNSECEKCCTKEKYSTKENCCTKGDCCKMYLVGKSITIADFCYMNFVLIFESKELKELFEKNLINFKVLKFYTEKLKEELKPYYKARETKYKLTYFDIAGRAECIRMAFKYVGLTFEDERIQFKDWPEKKKTLPLEFHQLPVLYEDDKPLVQSQAILLKLGMKFNLFPVCDPFAMTDVLTVIGGSTDLMESLAPLFTSGVSEDAKAKIKTSFIKEKLPLYFSKFEARLKNNISHTFICGQHMTIADFYLLGILKVIVFNPTVPADQKDFAKEVDAVWDTMPLLKAYYAKRMKDFEPLAKPTPISPPKA